MNKTIIQNSEEPRPFLLNYFTIVELIIETKCLRIERKILNVRKYTAKGKCNAITSGINTPKEHRSSRPEVFCKKRVLRNFVKFTGKLLCQNLFFSEVTGLQLY